MSTDASTAPAPAPAPNPINNLIDQLLSGLPFNGMKTYVAAAGLFATALVQVLVQKDYIDAFQSFMAGLAALGLRHAMAKA